jgi:hypothetical protein
MAFFLERTLLRRAQSRTTHPWVCNGSGSSSPPHRMPWEKHGGVKHHLAMCSSQNIAKMLEASVPPSCLKQYRFAQGTFPCCFGRCFGAAWWWCSCSGAKGTGNAFDAFWFRFRAAKVITPNPKPHLRAWEGLDLARGSGHRDTPISVWTPRFWGVGTAAC